MPRQQTHLRPPSRLTSALADRIVIPEHAVLFAREFGLRVAPQGTGHNADVRHMLERGLIEPARLRDLDEAIEPELYRYPAIDAAAFRRKLRDAILDSP